MRKMLLAAFLLGAICLQAMPGQAQERLPEYLGILRHRCGASHQYICKYLRAQPCKYERRRDSQKDR